MAERQREGSRERFLGREEEENKLGKKKIDWWGRIILIKITS